MLIKRYRTPRKMKKSCLLLNSILLIGCASSAIHGSTPLWQQAKHKQDTAQICLSDRIIDHADRGLKSLLQHAVDQGYITSVADALPRFSTAAVCLIDKPEPCCYGSYCVPPSKGNIASLKAGCTIGGSAWVAKHWPPICPPEWPDMPRCAAKHNPDYDYVPTLIHELAHIMIYQLGLGSPEHSNKIFSVGGPESLAIIDYNKTVTGNNIIH